MKQRMHTALIALLTMLALLLGGCASPSPCYQGMKAMWPVIGPEYRAYVTDDARLSTNDKAIRLRSADTVDQLIAAEEGGK